MRTWLTCGCAALALQTAFVLPVAALTTPEPMRPAEARGDERIRQVWWKPGMVIKLAGAQGQSLVVEMPKGMHLQAFMFSQQNIIQPDQYMEVDPATNKPIPPPAPPKEEGCEGNVNIKICVRLERFLFFIPYVPLTEQPFPMILVDKKKSKIRGKPDEETEYTIVFQLSTVEENEKPYYGVKVMVGDAPGPLPEPPPQPPPPPQPVPKAPPPVRMPAPILTPSVPAPSAAPSAPAPKPSPRPAPKPAATPTVSTPTEPPAARAGAPAPAAPSPPARPAVVAEAAPPQAQQMAEQRAFDARVAREIQELLKGRQGYGR